MKIIIFTVDRATESIAAVEGGVPDGVETLVAGMPAQEANRIVNSDAWKNNMNWSWTYLPPIGTTHDICFTQKE